jgi:NDP-mannose synthase
MYKAVILAGGKGTRLKPYTISIPKPLVPIGNVPILEILIKQLALNNFKSITITVNHLADLIKAFFGNGSKWGVEIDYSFEDMPLSTMGPLKLVNKLPDDFLVLNGDILTDLNFLDFFQFHCSNHNLFTISSYVREHKIDYGVLEVNQDQLYGFSEKPCVKYEVSMGIYAVNKKILDYIPTNKTFGFDDLMLRLIDEKKSVSVKKFNGYWLDIGRPDDYEKAIEDYEKQGFSV